MVMRSIVKVCLFLCLSVRLHISRKLHNRSPPNLSCMLHFVRLANALLKDRESARNNHVFACNFVKYSPVLTVFFHSETQQ